MDFSCFTAACTGLVTFPKLFLSQDNAQANDDLNITTDMTSFDCERMGKENGEQKMQWHKKRKVEN